MLTDPMTLVFLDEARKLQYYKKVRRIFGSSLISYLPLGEQAGSIAYDLSGNGLHGASVGVTLGEPGIGDGKTSYGFDGLAAYVNWYSAGLAAAFNGAEGTLMVWAKVANAGVWTDGAERRIVSLGTSGEGNVIYIRKQAGNNQLLVNRNDDVTDKFVIVAISQTTWFPVTITWSVADDQVKVYVNGAQSGSTQTGLSAFTGAIVNTRCNVGATTTVPAQVWFGNIQHVALGNRALTPAEVAEVSTP